MDAIPLCGFPLKILLPSYARFTEDLAMVYSPLFNVGVVKFIIMLKMMMLKAIRIP